MKDNLYSVLPAFLSYLGQVIMNKLKNKPLRNKDIFIQIYPFIFFIYSWMPFFSEVWWLAGSFQKPNERGENSLPALLNCLHHSTAAVNGDTEICSFHLVFFLRLRCFLFFLFTQSQNAFFYYHLSTGFELLVLPEKQTYLLYLTSISFYL